MFDFELPHQFFVTVFGLQLIGDVVAESLLLLGITEQVYAGGYVYPMCTSSIVSDVRRNPNN